MENWRDLIEQRTGSLAGKSVIKGTKISVQHILERLEQGWSDDELLAAHPRLLPEHLRAAEAYARERDGNGPTEPLRS
jgi:uncharacterized protein (DUF433 family)